LRANGDPSENTSLRMNVPPQALRITKDQLGHLDFPLSIEQQPKSEGYLLCQFLDVVRTISYVNALKPDCSKRLAAVRVSLHFMRWCALNATSSA
jgi:hypothetical protein